MKLIGIDPGTKTGYAVWNTETGQFDEIATTSIIEAAFDIVLRLQNEKVHLFVENPNTWVPFRNNTTSRDKIQGAGSIKRDYAIWMEFAEIYGIKLTPIRLQGTMKKTQPAFFKRLTGWQGRTSQHARDAAMLVFRRM